MPEPLKTALPESSPPVVAYDIPCPQCEYNLRGCSGPRCPECGLAFEPRQLLAQYQNLSRQVPTAAWVVRTMRRHPIAFWSMPQVRRGKQPDVEVLAPLMVWAWAYGMGTLLLMGSPFLISMSAGSASFAGAALVVSVAAVALGAVLPILWALHTALCWLVLPVSKRGSGRLCAESVTIYCVVWARYVLPFVLPFAAALIWVVDGHAGLLGRIALLVTSVLLAIPCIFWAVSQYHGALAASGGSRLKAWWCVLSNPLWYPFYLVLGREAGGAM